MRVCEPRAGNEREGTKKKERKRRQVAMNRLYSCARVLSQRTAGHSVAVCCNLLADMCSLVLPPACRLLSACHIQEGVHIGKLAMLPYMLPHSGGQKQHNRRVFSLRFVLLPTHTREHSTGLATAGATRPLDD